MRTIKFRAWGKTDKKMINDIELGDFDDGYVLGCYDKDAYVKDFEWMQFTGLTDKNGKDIYEGDILCCERDYWDKKRNLIVEWDEVDAGFFLMNKNEPVDSETFNHESAFVVKQNQREVIGNIYENPELINKNNG